MHCNYGDILSRCGRPLWWDEAGVPRHEVFHPSKCHDIYAREVALLDIRCQGCGHLFLVALSMSLVVRVLKSGLPSLAKRIEEGTVHYGDPPNLPCCPGGATMNCLDIQVMEYWRLDRFKWVRDKSLEVVLPDGKELGVGEGECEWVRSDLTL